MVREMKEMDVVNLVEASKCCLEILLVYTLTTTLSYKGKLPLYIGY